MKTMTKKLVTLLAVSMLFMTMVISCALNAGRQFPMELVRTISIGSSTKQDVLRMFGNPYRTGLEDGQDTWTYGHYRKQAFKESEASDLVVRFDDKGVVSSYSFSTTKPEAAK